MRSNALFALAATATFSGVFAQSLDNDYPSACQSVCGPVASRSQSCDNQFDNDQDELNCICTGPDLNNLIPQCQQCIDQNRGSSDDDDDDYEDITELLNACGFTATTGTAPTSTLPTPTAPTPVISVYTTVVCESDYDNDNDDDDDDCDTFTFTSTQGIPGPSVTVYTTTRTDTDDDDNETDVETDLVTSIVTPTGTGAAQTTLVTTTDNDGNSVTSTSTMMNGGQTAAQTSASATDNLAKATAAPLIGAGLGAVIAAVVAL